MYIWVMAQEDYHETQASSECSDCSSPDLQSMDRPGGSAGGSSSTRLRLSKEWLDEILRCLMYAGLDAKIKAAKEIRRLTKKSAKNRAYLGAAGVILPLVSMLSSPVSEAKEAALLALLNLAVGNESNKVRVVKAGALPALVEMLQCEDASVRESAAAAVLTLSATPMNKSVIGCSGVIPPLVQILMCGSIQGKVDAVMALCNLSVGTENLEQILIAGALSPLVKILKECKKNSKFAEKTTALLESLLSVEEGRTALVKEEGAILALVETVEDGSQQSRERAVGALLNLCTTDAADYRPAILKEGVIPGVLELTVQGTPKAQMKARTLLQLLRDLSSSPKSCSSPDVIESIVCNIAAHVDGIEQGSTTAKQMLEEMVQMSLERTMKQLQRRALLTVPSQSPSR